MITLTTLEPGMLEVAVIGAPTNDEVRDALQRIRNDSEERPLRLLANFVHKVAGCGGNSITSSISVLVSSEAIPHARTEGDPRRIPRALRRRSGRQRQPTPAPLVCAPPCQIMAPKRIRTPVSEPVRHLCRRIRRSWSERRRFSVPWPSAARRPPHRRRVLWSDPGVARAQLRAGRGRHNHDPGRQWRG